MKLLMVASSKEQVQAVQHSRDLPGLAGFDHELRQAARRRRGATSQLALPTGMPNRLAACLLLHLHQAQLPVQALLTSQKDWCGKRCRLTAAAGPAVFIKPARLPVAHFLCIILLRLSA